MCCFNFAEARSKPDAAVMMPVSVCEPSVSSGGPVARQAPVLAHYNAMHANSFDSGDCASLGKQGEAGFGFKTGS